MWDIFGQKLIITFFLEKVLLLKRKVRINMNKLISSCKWYLISTKNLPTIRSLLFYQKLPKVHYNFCIIYKITHSLYLNLLHII